MGSAEQQSFDALKAALTSPPVLRVWDPERPTRLLTDASELAVSAILEQPNDAGAFHPVAFESRKLTQPERSYPPHLLELLAVVHALKALRPYLLDKPQPAMAAPVASFVAAGPAAKSPRFLHANFAAAVRAALPCDPVLGPLAAAAQAAAGAGPLRSLPVALHLRLPRRAALPAR